MSKRVKLLLPHPALSVPLDMKPNEMTADPQIEDEFPVAHHSVTSTRVIDSATIFRGESEIMIRHDGVIYRMKITRQGKLILNK